MAARWPTAPLDLYVGWWDPRMGPNAQGGPNANLEQCAKLVAGMRGGSLSHTGAPRWLNGRRYGRRCGQLEATVPTMRSAPRPMHIACHIATYTLRYLFA